MINTNITDILGTSLNNLDGIITGLDKNTGDNDPLRDSFVKSNSSFSGSDCTVIAQINQTLISLGNVETFSYSIFREKSPVRTLGRSNAKGYTSGGRTISGSIVFIVFDRHPLYDIIKAMKYNPRKLDTRSTNPVADQISPIDLFLVFRNEYGHESLLKLYGVEFLQEGQTHSINDLYSENVIQYVAKDMDVMINSKDNDEFHDLVFQRRLAGQFVDNYLSSLLTFKQNILYQITMANKNIMESELLKQKDPTQSRALDTDIRYYNMKLTKLNNDLNSINKQITVYESNLNGWNAQHDDSMILYDNLRQSSVTTPSYKG